MKKITYLLFLLILMFMVSNCTGYKPIFNQSNLNFEIINYAIEGETALGRNIYSKIYSLSNSKKNNGSIKSIDIYINSTKIKDSTTKNKSGKITEYRITLTSEIHVTDFVTGSNILKEIITLSTTYKVQSTFSQTIDLEKKSIEDLLNKTYEKILIKFSEKF